MSWDALFSLQGHSPYILGAYGVTAALMAVEASLLWRRARARRLRARLQASLQTSLQTHENEARR